MPRSRKSRASRGSRKSITVGKTYKIHDNGNRPFSVNIAPKGVKIYKAVDDEYLKLVKEYKNVEESFIGVSKKNATTKASAGFGPKFRGNTILLHLGGLRYVYIGETIYEFTAPEPINRYFSTVGPNDVPYPVAVSDNYLYFMIGPALQYKDVKIGGEYVDKKFFTGKDHSDAYSEYYKIFPENKIKDRKKTHWFKNVKLIHARIW